MERTEGNARTLGVFLQRELGGRSLENITPGFVGAGYVEIKNMPGKVEEEDINEAITRFYQEIGFKVDEESGLKESLVFYGGKNRCDDVRVVVVSDLRDGENQGRVLITSNPLYAAEKKV